MPTDMSTKNSIDTYVGVKWLNAAKESLALERAVSRFSKLMNEERYTDGATPSRRLRKSAVALLQAEHNFISLKQRASE